MAQINVSNVSFCYEGSTERIFDQLSFSVDASWKIGFLGVNGKGKTTFLRLLRGEKEYEGSISSDVSFDYFPYHIEDTQRAYPFAEICKTLKPGVELWRLNVELEQLKLSPETLYRPFITLSQVEQTKVMLALLFSGENEFLLLDEPTNLPDAETRELFKEYLKKKQGFLLVSHDRDLLDACVDHLLILNNNKIEVQNGNFSEWWGNKNMRESFVPVEQEALIEAREYGITYKDAIHPVFSNLSFTLRRGERVVVHGGSGCGKSTLIKAILAQSTEKKEELNYTESGMLETAPGLVVSYVNKDTAFLKGSISEFSKRQGISESLLCNILRQLDFDSAQLVKNMEEYTEGQKKKVLIAASLLKPAHLYIWDEPLNYIDVFSRMHIEKLILEFKPTMLIVEPDVRFREKIATKIVEM